MNECAKDFIDDVAMVNYDAKCKVSVDKPDIAIASISRGKRMIVGTNQLLEVSDHSFSIDP